MKKFVGINVILSVCTFNLSLGMEFIDSNRKTNYTELLSEFICNEIFDKNSVKKDKIVNLIKELQYDKRSQWDNVRHYLDDDHLGKIENILQARGERVVITNPQTGQKITHYFNNRTSGLISLYTIQLNSIDKYTKVFCEIMNLKNEIQNKNLIIYLDLSDKDRIEYVYNIQKLSVCFLLQMESKYSEGRENKIVSPAQILTNIFGDTSKQNEILDYIQRRGFNNKSHWDNVKYFMNSKHLAKLVFLTQMSTQIKSLTNPRTGETLMLMMNDDTKPLSKLFTMEMNCWNQHYEAFNIIIDFKNRIESKKDLFSRLTDYDIAEHVMNLQKLAACIISKSPVK